jgi:hypothetical protein
LSRRHADILASAMAGATETETERERARPISFSTRRADARDRLGVAAAVGFGGVCAIGVLDPLWGALLLALFAATGSIRALRKNLWLPLFAVAATVASRFVPVVGLVLAAATVILLLARAVYLVRNLRVVTLGLLAYAMAIASALALVPGVRWGATAYDLPLRGVDPQGLAVGGAFAGGTFFMLVALLHAARRGYPPPRALEVMSILPMILAGMVLPFATGAFASSGLPDVAATLVGESNVARARGWVTGAAATARTLARR